MKKRKPLLIVIMLIVFTLAFVFIFSGSSLPGLNKITDASAAPQKFQDYEDMKSYLANSKKIAALIEQAVNMHRLLPAPGIAILQESSKDAMNAPAADGETGAPADYSKTNVQVAGVDEADTVKSDGKYLYLVSGNRVVIAAAYPPEKARVMSQIKLSDRPLGIFVDGDYLVVFHRKQGLTTTIYNIADKDSPRQAREYTIKGASYISSRLIGKYVYLVAGVPVSGRLPADNLQEQPELPRIVEENGAITTIPASSIHYMGNIYPEFRYTLVVALNLESLDRKTTSFLTGAAQDVYVSENNLYLVTSGPGRIVPLFEQYLEQAAEAMGTELSGLSLEQKINRLEAAFAGNSDETGRKTASEAISSARQELLYNLDQTSVQKFRIDGYEARYLAEVDVPGRILNQFSMDEDAGYFRIATTRRDLLGWNSSKNNIYVYDQGMKKAGELTGLAPGERIYAARFMGSRAYLVTFRETDPFFVIDLKDPAAPKMLGYLKIPGFSSYLHPYDENLLIGIGKETNRDEVVIQENVPRAMIWPPVMPSEGVKIALFNVSDPEQPEEISKYIVPERYSDSSALNDHKAVLFSREKNLLALPVTRQLNYSVPGAKSPPFRMQTGAYVFHISQAKGITCRGMIDHPVGAGSQYDQSAVQRILYIDDVLYTISGAAVKMNRINDLTELNYLNF